MDLKGKRGKFDQSAAAGKVGNLHSVHGLVHMSSKSPDPLNKYINVESECYQAAEVSVTYFTQALKRSLPFTAPR